MARSLESTCSGIRLLSVRTPQKPFSVAVLLAVVALAMHPSIRAGWRRRSALAFYTLAAVAMWVLCLGPAPTLMSKPLHLQGAVCLADAHARRRGRARPARFWILATLCLAVAAAIALGYIVRTPRDTPASAVAIVARARRRGLAGSSRCSSRRPGGRRRRPRSRASSCRSASVPDLIALYRATQHRRPMVNGYSGYFAPHYGALVRICCSAASRPSSASWPPLATSKWSSTTTATATADGGRFSARSQTSQRRAVRRRDYTVYRVPQSGERLQLPQFSAAAAAVLPAFARPTAEDRVSRMTDGDLITPLGHRRSAGSDQCGHRRPWRAETGRGRRNADRRLSRGLPPRLAIDVSRTARRGNRLGGEPALMTYVAALEMPRTVPLSFPLAIAGAPHQACVRPAPIPSSTGRSPSSRSSVRETAVHPSRGIRSLHS